MESGNQQERSVALAFVAGLICGEGCIYLGLNDMRKRRGIIHVIPGIRIWMQDDKALEKAHNLMLSIGLPSHFSNKKKPVIHIAGMKRCERWLEALYPHLVGKKLEAADVVLEFIKLRKMKSIKDPHGKDEADLVDKIRNINSGKGYNRRNDTDILRDYTSDA